MRADGAAVGTLPAYNRSAEAAKGGVQGVLDVDGRAGAGDMEQGRDRKLHGTAVLQVNLLSRGEAFSSSLAANASVGAVQSLQK